MISLLQKNDDAQRVGDLNFDAQSARTSPAWITRPVTA